MLRSIALILSLLLAAPALARTADDAAANRLFVEAVQLWNRAEGESAELRPATLQKVHANLKTIIERHSGSTLAVRLVIGETVGPLSLARVAAAQARVLRDCPECPEMVVVPAGTTWLASGRNVTIAAPFAVGKFEVTFEEWDACLAQGGCRYRPVDRGWGWGRHPVIGVSWDDAQDYVAWLSQKTGKPYRLLSEAEWEYAAQAGAGREAVVKPGAGQANCRECGSGWNGRQSAPVGSFEANAFGLHDMLGNVGEWTADCSNENHSGAAVDASARATGDCSRRVLRGGSWANGPEYSRSASRDRDDTVRRAGNLGFRVARTL